MGGNCSSLFAYFSKGIDTKTDFKNDILTMCFAIFESDNNVFLIIS